MLLKDIFILKDDANVYQKDAICQMDKISITSIFELACNFALNLPFCHLPSSSMAEIGHKDVAFLPYQLRVNYISP